MHKQLNLEEFSAIPHSSKKKNRKKSQITIFKQKRKTCRQEIFNYLGIGKATFDSDKNNRD